MDKMKMFIECHVPITACNMRCKYCYVTQNGWWKNKEADLDLCCEKIQAALSPKRLGGICMINLCATGETLIDSRMIDIIYKILADGHYVMVVTNGTLTKRFEQLCGFPAEYRERLFLKCSFHYLELKRMNKLDVYFNNIAMIHEHGISFTVEITPDDSYIPYIPEIKEVCMRKLGALCHVTVPRDERKKGFPLMTELARCKFVEQWRDFDSQLFNFKESIFEVKRNEFCYAGQWGFVLELKNGDYAQCYKGKRLGNLYKDLDKPLNLFPVGHNCGEGHCFNGHAFLGFGLIPELDTPNYADMRNRISNTGAEWLSPKMKSFMQRKLVEDNEEFNFKDKLKADVKSVQYKSKIKKVLRVK